MYVVFLAFFSTHISLNLNHDVGSSAVQGESPTISLPTNCAPLPTTSLSRSLISFVRFFDSADGVYSTSSASELGNCRHPTSLMSTARHGLKDCIADRPGYANLAKGTDVQFPSRLATEQVISVAPSMLR